MSTLVCDGNELNSYFAAATKGDGEHGVVLCHGFPRRASGVGLRYSELADRISAQMDMSVLTFNFRGSGRSEGDFSIAGWKRDLSAAVAHMRRTCDVDHVWVAGFGTGGSIALAVAAEDQAIDGVVSFAARAHFDDWSKHADDLVEHAKSVGLFQTAGFPEDVKAWASEFDQVRPLDAISKIAPRPVMIVHGREDERVPVQDARDIKAAGGDAVELRIIHNATHRLQGDPRTIALLLGWLELRE